MSSNIIFRCSFIKDYSNELAKTGYEVWIALVPVNFSGSLYKYLHYLNAGFFQPATEKA